MSKLQRQCLAVVLALSSTTSWVHAQEAPSGWQLSLATGYGAMQNPLKASHNPHTVLLPQLQYYGERFYLENFTLGYSLVETTDLLIDLETRLNEDGLFYELNGLQRLFATDLFSYKPNQTPIRETPEFADIERSVSYLGGLNISFPTTWGQWSLGHYRDVSSVHHGAESQLRYRQQGQFAGFKWGLELGMTYKDQALVHYYYQLNKAELGAYKTKQTTHGTQNYHLRVVLNRPITEQWFYVLSAEHTWLGSGITDSVLIEHNDYSTYFIGVGYAF